MSGAKRTLLLLAALCFALFLLYGVYFNAFGANAESMMAFSASPKAARAS